MEKKVLVISLSQFLNVPHRLYNIFGIELVKIKSDGNANYLRLFKIRAYFLFIFVFIQVIGKFLIPIFHLETFRDIADLFGYIATVGFVVTTFVKVGTILYFKETLWNAINEIDDLFPKTIEEQIKYKIEIYKSKINNNIKNLTIFNLFTANLFIIYPILQSSIEYYYQNMQFVYRYPFHIFYPYNDKVTSIYIINYIFQIISTYPITCVYLGADTLLASTVYVSSMYFDILASKFEEYQPIGNEIDISYLRKLIKYHVINSRIAKNLNVVFNISCMINFAGSSVMICLVGFAFLFGTGFWNTSKFFFFLLSAMVHVYFLCYFGTILMKSSESVAVSVYNHKWYKGNIRYQKMICCILLHTQRPTMITAYKFFPINMETFKMVITTSYQFFTLLRTSFVENT